MILSGINSSIIKAQSEWNGVSVSWGPSIGDEASLKSPFFSVVNDIYILGTIIAVAMIIYGGVMLITASGDEQKVKKGGTIIQNSLIGLIVLFLIKAVFMLVLKGVGAV